MRERVRNYRWKPWENQCPRAATLLFLPESPALSPLIWFELSFCHALPRTMTQYLPLSTFYWRVEQGWKWRSVRFKLITHTAFSLSPILSQLRTECTGNFLASPWFTLRIKRTMGSQGAISCERQVLNGSSRRHGNLPGACMGSFSHLLRCIQRHPLNICASRMRMESRVTILN